MPTWELEALQPKVELVDDVDLLECGLGDTRPLMPYALTIYGCLHLLDNIPKEFPNKLMHWQAFYKQLHICWIFLSDRGRRLRFVHTCLPPDDEDTASMFSEFSGQLLDHRWFSVFAFVNTMKPLMRVIRVHWDENAFRRKVDNTELSEKELSLADVTAIVKDRLFRAYAAFVARLGKMFLQISRYVEGCPCHGPRPKSQRAPAWACPLGGCHAPALATGSLQSMLLSHFDCHVADVVQSLEGEHDSGDLQKSKGLLASDIAAARAYIHLILELKMDVWRRLPLRLAGLAHPSSVVQASVAAEALATFDASVANGGALSQHHPLTRKFLEPGAVIHQEYRGGKWASYRQTCSDDSSWAGTLLNTQPLQSSLFV